MNAPLSKEQIALLMSDTATVRTASLLSTSLRQPLWSRLFSQLATALAAWRQRRAVLAELGTLTDRELTDIGLVRRDLGRVFDPAFARARTDALFRAANV